MALYSQLELRYYNALSYPSSLSNPAGACKHEIRRIECNPQVNNDIAKPQRTKLRLPDIVLKYLTKDLSQVYNAPCLLWYFLRPTPSGFYLRVSRQCTTQ